MTYPDLAFIIPYRDRERQKEQFTVHMKKLLANNDVNNYVFLFVHQNDRRIFNRGAMKNFGFLHLKDKYPNNYRDINIIFNDIDTYPYEYIDYTTTNGSVKHFFGFEHTLGGIFSIKGGDYEKIGGFPNLWGWGYEDNVLKHRVDNEHLQIDRTYFSNIKDKSLNNYYNSPSNDIKLVCDRSMTAALNEKADLDTFNDLINYSWRFNDAENILEITYFECRIPYSETGLREINVGITGPRMKPRHGYFRKNWNTLFNSNLQQ